MVEEHLLLTRAAGPVNAQGFVVGDYRERRLSDGHVALLGRRTREWAIVSDPVAALLRSVANGGPLPRSLAQNEAFQPVANQLATAGILVPPGAAAADERRLRPPPTLLIKVTGACNIACNYCYDYSEARWSGRIDFGLVCRTIDGMLDRDPRLTIVFHGGEPLLAFRLIRDVVAYCEGRARSEAFHIGYALQTNGLLLTEDIILFLADHRFDVGLSLDGPRSINDAGRKDHHGRGTFDRVMRQLESHRDFVSKRVGVLAVVETDSREKLEEIFEFFAGLEVSTLKLMGVHGGGRSKAVEVGDDGFVDFLVMMLERIGKGEWSRPYLINLVELMDRFLGREEGNICMSRSCGAGREFLVIDAANNIRACDITYEDAFLLIPANDALASRDPAGEARASPNAQGLRAREDWLLQKSSCAECEWLSLCGGSCPGKALMLNGSILGVDELECRTRKAIFPRILELLSAPEGHLLRYYTERHRSRVIAMSGSG